MGGKCLTIVHVAKLRSAAVEVHVAVIDGDINIAFDACCYRSTATKETTNIGMVYLSSQPRCFRLFKIGT